MMPPEEVAVLIDRAERNCERDGSILLNLPREQRRRMLARYVFDGLRRRAAGADR